MVKNRKLQHIADLQAIFWRAKKLRERLAKATVTGTDEELIQKAVNDGKVKKCPDGAAHGALKWGAFGGRLARGED